MKRCVGLIGVLVVLGLGGCVDDLNRHEDLVACDKGMPASDEDQAFEEGQPLPEAAMAETAEKSSVVTGKIAEAKRAAPLRRSIRMRERRSTGGLLGSRGSSAPPHAGIRGLSAQPNTESYDAVDPNDWKRVTDAPLSTLSIDVDTASYSNIRRMIREGRVPVHGAIRIEEMLNYFNYDYPAPTGDTPFAVHTELGAAPWNEDHRLVRVGIKGKEIARGQRPPSNLVFLLDVSGSMSMPDKLPLLKRAFKVLVGQLDARDTVSIVVYAGASGMALPPTKGDRKAEILQAIGSLRAGGGTHGAAGIRLAYEVARKQFIEGGTNRVILATDGDMNVGTTSRSELVDLVQSRAKGGVFLSVLGFGTGNLKDSTMEAIADKGNGNYAYIDSVAEARKVLGSQFGGTLITIAKDVKIQVEFNPTKVAGYRLIGYENRVLQARDFNDDSKDAGELGAGHTVTALYEVVPAGKPVPGASVDALKYQTPSTPTGDSPEMMTVKLRYKQPQGDTSRLVSQPVLDTSIGARASQDFQWAMAVAGFGMLLRDSKHRGDLSWDRMLGIATAAVGPDPTGQRMEMVVLAKQARELAQSKGAPTP